MEGRCFFELFANPEIRQRFAFRLADAVCDKTVRDTRHDTGIGGLSEDEVIKLFRYICTQAAQKSFVAAARGDFIEFARCERLMDIVGLSSADIGSDTQKFGQVRRVCLRNRARHCWDSARRPLRRSAFRGDETMHLRLTCLLECERILGEIGMTFEAIGVSGSARERLRRKLSGHR